MFLRNVVRATVLAALASALLLPGSVSADRSGNRTDARAFLKAAGPSNLFEIQSGRLAVDRGQSAEVKAIGQMLVADHTAEYRRLRALANRYDVRLPRRPTPRQRQQIETLAGLSGAEFDRAFLEAQAAAHREAIALYRLAALAGPRAIRIDAVNALPVLGMHAGRVAAALAD
jgi:putative membrane protein